MSISIRRVALSGLIAGPIELVLKIIEGELYLNSLLRQAIEPVNPAWMANVTSGPGMIGFIVIMMLLGLLHMYMMRRCVRASTRDSPQLPAPR